MAALVRSLDVPDTGHEWEPVLPFPRLRCCLCGQVWEAHQFTPRNQCRKRRPAPSTPEKGN